MMKIAITLAIFLTVSAKASSGEPVEPLAQEAVHEFSIEAAKQKRVERKAAIEWALKYASDKAWRFRLDRPKLSFKEMAEINAACEMLGEFRAQEAVRIGFVGLTLRTHAIRFESVPLDDFPYVRMLIAIGRPASDRIIDSMKTATYDGNMRRAYKNVLRLQAYVLREVVGHESGLARLEEVLRDFKGEDPPQVRELLAIYKLRESESDIRRAYWPDPPPEKAARE